MKRVLLAACVAVLAVSAVSAVKLALPRGADPAPEADAAPAGVAGAQVTIDHSWPSAAELRWLRAYLRWERDLHRDLDDALRVANERRRALARRDDAAVAAVREATRPFARCAASIADAAGKPPSQRLRSLGAAAVEGCRLYAKAFGFLTSGEPYKGDLVERVDFELEQGVRAFATLGGRLPLGAQRELPEREGGGGPSHVEPRYSRAAAEIAAKEVEVRCWSGADWRRLLRQQELYGPSPHTLDAFAIVGGERIHLSPHACAWIDAATARKPASAHAQSRAGYGLLVLAHEAQHSADIYDEAEATCYALQMAPQLADALGIAPERIERLVDVFWTEFNELPPEYRSPECRAGGKLDLHPGDARWP